MYPHSVKKEVLCLALTDEQRGVLLSLAALSAILDHFMPDVSMNHSVANVPASSEGLGMQHPPCSRWWQMHVPGWCRCMLASASAAAQCPMGSIPTRPEARRLHPGLMSLLCWACKEAQRPQCRLSLSWFALYSGCCADA